MKVKHTLIPFIPVALAMIVLKLMSLFGLDSNGLFLGMNKMNISYVVIGLALALFIICIIMNIFDRKTAPVYAVKKNPVAGVFAVLSGIAAAGASFLTLVNSDMSNQYFIMIAICALLSIPAAIALILMSKVHFTGKSTVSGISALFIFPALWCCAELVSEFMNATKVSISATEMTPMFCYIFLTLYLFSHSMIVSRIKGRNPVKACFIYGLPAVAITLSYGIYAVCTGVVEGAYNSTMLVGIQFVMFALYSLSFLIEMFTGTLTKDEVEIIDGIPDDDTYEKSYINSSANDEVVIPGTKPKDEVPEEKSFSDFEGLDDFVMGYDNDDEEEPIPYLTKQEKEEKEPFSGVLIDSDLHYNNSDENTESNSKKSEQNKELSDVDKLLQELENKK